MRVLKCFIVEERRISSTYSELVKQRVFFYCVPCSNDMHAKDVAAFDKLESYFSDRLTFLTTTASYKASIILSKATTSYACISLEQGTQKTNALLFH